MKSEENLLQLNVDQKLKIALELILNEKLKDNHDDTLFEKLCSLIKNELPQNNLHTLLENNVILDSLKVENYSLDYWTGHKLQLIVIFRVFSSALSNDVIFEKYFSNQLPIITIFNSVFNNFHLFNSEIDLVYSFFDFACCITAKQFGAEWFLNNLSEEAVPEKLCYTQFLHYFKIEHTHYIQNVKYIFLSNLINSTSNSSVEVQLKINFLVKQIISSETTNVDEINYHILLLVKNKIKFIEDYKLLDLCTVKFGASKELFNITMKTFCIILNAFQKESVELDPIVKTFTEKLYTSCDCFIVMSFFNNITQNHLMANNESSFVQLWTLYSKLLVNLIKTHYGMKTEQHFDGKYVEHTMLVNKTYGQTSYSTFELNSFKELIKINVDSVDPSDLVFLLTELGQVLPKLTNRKHSTLCLLFLERCCHSSNVSVRNEIVDSLLPIYLDVLNKNSQFSISVLKSVRTILEIKGSVNRLTFIDRLVPFLHFFAVYLKKSDFSEEDIVEIIFEIVYQLFLVIDLDSLPPSSTVTALIDSFKSVLKLYSDAIECGDYDGCNRALILLTLRSASNKLPSFDMNCFDFKKRLEQDLSVYDLCYKQCIMLNLKHSMLSNSESIELSTLKLLSQDCAEHVDLETQLLLIDLYNLFCVNASKVTPNCLELFCDCDVFKVICFLVQEPLFSHQVKLKSLKLFDDLLLILLNNGIDLKSMLSDSNKVFDEENVKSLEYLFQNHEMKTLCEMPLLHVLDDILLSTTSQLDDIVMDCY